MGTNVSVHLGPSSEPRHHHHHHQHHNHQNTAEQVQHLTLAPSTTTHHHHGTASTCLTHSTTENIVHNSSPGLFVRDNKLKRLRQKIKTKLKKGSNHAQVFREFASLLSTRDLARLYEEYKGTLFLKELSLHAESARPIASNIRNDLSELYDFKHNSDISLVYKGVDFAVHKAIVCVRCPYFRELLGKKSPGSVVTVNLEIKGLRVELFNDLLKYLYTGELAGSYDARSNSSSYQALIRISQECGVPNALAHDLKHLLETGIYSDASLCFQQSSTENDSSVDSSQLIKKCVCFEQTEFACHQSILAARSPFFRNVILRQQRRNATLQHDSLNQRIKIVLDESIIPRRFARVLLHVMYRDADDLMSLVQCCLCKCAASNPSSSKDNQSNLVKITMDLYEIARFLEIDFLVQSCEDLMIDLLSVDTLMIILKWSEQAHGSPWVKRQALCFLKEEFSLVISSVSLLSQLEHTHLFEALKSDFLEASELDILKAVVKWGEMQLAKQQAEERDPNLLSSHSLSRKSHRKKEIDDTKLLYLIDDLLSLVRLGHVLPIGSELLSNLAKRSLVDTTWTAPMVTTDNPSHACRTLNAWLRHRNNGSDDFKRPRYFSPYFEECKIILEERLGHRVSADDNFDNVTSDQKCSIPIPDTLYMVDKTQLLNGVSSVVSDSDLAMSPLDKFHFCFTSSSSSSVMCYEDIDKPRPNLPILEERVLLMMRQREQELKTSPFCVRALKVTHNRCQALRLIQLRVVREFGFPDIACEVLHLRNVPPLPKAKQRTLELDDSMSQISFAEFSGSGRPMTGQTCDIAIPPPPPRPVAAAGFLSTNSQICDPFSYHSELKLEASSPYELESQFSSTESHRTLSDIIPDIALATGEMAKLKLGYEHLS